MDTGSREENASTQEPRAPFRFHRNGKGSRTSHPLSLRGANGSRVCAPSGRLRDDDRLRDEAIHFSA
ncbi:hypothetical protein CWS35_01845 [Bradyrhizobium sp. SK17]|nr:hypothetical protein CWS35_01845 [Bradyrhizobium sp. SK17]